MEGTVGQRTRRRVVAVVGGRRPHRCRPPRIARVGRVLPVVERADQNRKYFCAIGNSVAGSQVSNWPSARTS